MRAFVVARRSLVTFYNELFFLVGINLIWWATGGIFVLVMALLGWLLFVANGPWWLAPCLQFGGSSDGCPGGRCAALSRDIHGSFVLRGWLPQVLETGASA